MPAGAGLRVDRDDHAPFPGLSTTDLGGAAEGISDPHAVGGGVEQVVVVGRMANDANPCGGRRLSPFLRDGLSGTTVVLPVPVMWPRGSAWSVNPDGAPTRLPGTSAGS